MASREFNSSDGGDTLARDAILALIVGFSSGALAIPVVLNLGIEPRIPLASMPVIAAAVSAIALLAARQVAGGIPSLFEFLKFSLVGALNSFVDFGVLNLLILTTGVAAGAGFLTFKSTSVTLGVVNSYLWNKYWTFDASRSGAARREFIAFLAVTLVAVALNVAGAGVIVNLIGAPKGVSARLWANVGAVSGAGLTLFTNFFGYKFLVFRKLSAAAQEV